MKVSITTLTIILATCMFTGCASNYHVSTAGLDGNPGTKAKPFKTISAAAAIAQPGDTITVHEGVYRERVNPPRGGTSDKNELPTRPQKAKRLLSRDQRSLRIGKN